MSDFTPPPRRELPPEVRDRLRRQLWRELDRPARFRVSRVRAPLAAAAGVAVLAAGAVIIAQSVPTAHEAAPALPQPTPVSRTTPTTDLARANTELDRCVNAVKSSPQHDAYPDRQDWSVSFTTEVSGVDVTAARADGKPVFCESTLTSVSVSNPDVDPAYAPGVSTGVLFASPNGTVAGVLDPTWDTFEITPADGSDSMLAAPEKGDGMFVLYTTAALTSQTALGVQQLPADMPFDQPERPADDDLVFPVRIITSAPAPLVTVVDRPAPADRTSTRAKELAGCMTATTDPQPDRDSWQAGAATMVKGSELIMAVNSRGVATCQWQPDPATRQAADPSDQMFQPYMQFTRTPEPVDAAQMPVVTGGDGGLVILGTVRADATKMTLVLDGNTELDTDVKAGTFVANVPDSLVDDSGQLADDHLATLTATIYDSKGNTLYRGPLNAH
ncbi:hypothetical protein GCM10029964_032690 [Kibdelosporangium lantanae]